jgi:hypothetical protein
MREKQLVIPLHPPLEKGDVNYLTERNLFPSFIKRG